MDRESPARQLGGELGKVMDGGFATGKDHDLAPGPGRGIREVCGVCLLDIRRDPVGVPCTGGIAPWTFYRAALEANEVGGFPEVDALPLPCMETFVDREQFHGV